MIWSAGRNPAATATTAAKSATAGPRHAAAAASTAAATATGPVEQRSDPTWDGNAGPDAGWTDAGPNAGNAGPWRTWPAQYAWAGSGSETDHAVPAAADTCPQVTPVSSTATTSPPDTQVQPKSHGCLHKAESQQRGRRWCWWRQFHPCLASWCPAADAGRPGRGSPADAAGPDAGPTNAAAATATA